VPEVSFKSDGCGAGRPQLKNLQRIAIGDIGHYSSGFAESQGSVALLIVDRLFQRENNEPPAQTSDQDRGPVLVVSDLNSDNAAGREHFKIGLEVAGALFYVGNFPEDLAVRIENGWAILCAAQRLLPPIQQ